MKQSLKNQILEYLQKQYPKVVHSGEIERFAMGLGFKASNGTRRCRELVGLGLITRSLNEKREAMYQAIDGKIVELVNLRNGKVIETYKKHIPWWNQPEYKRKETNQTLI